MQDGSALDPREAVHTVPAAGTERVDVPRRLVRVALLYIACAAALHVTWIVTGREAWLLAFRFLNGAFLVSYAGIAVWQAIAARRFFRPADPLRVVWSLLIAAAIVRCAGHLLTNVLAWSAPQAPDGIAQVGRLIAGPGYLTLVAIALAGVMAVYRRLGLLVRLELVDLAPVAGVGLFAVWFLHDLTVWRASASIRESLLDAIGWTSDPLLAILLLEAIVIRRSAVRMGAGYVSVLLDAILIKRSTAQLGASYVWRCWGAFAAGIFLTSLGDMGYWAEAHRFINWPWTSLLWYVWPLAEAAFAVAPAWQVVACRSARRYDHVPAGAAIVRPIAFESPGRTA